MHGHLSFQKGSISSITNNIKRSGLMETSDFHQHAISSSIKTPSANLIINAMKTKSFQKMSKGVVQGFSSQTSCQKELDSSLSYP